MSELPEGWEVFSLGEITEWSSGNTPSKVKPMFWNGNVPWISAVSMRGNYFFDSELKITNEAIEQGAKIAEPNTLLLLVRGSMLWNKIPIGITGCRVSFNQDVKCIAPKIKYTTAAFLLYWFLSRENHLMHMVTGTGIGAGKLDTTDLQKLAVPLPPLPEQRKIAQILSTWDRAIATTEKQIANSKQQKKALMQQLLTGKKRLAGFSGDWEYLKASELFKTVSIKNNSENEELLAVTQDCGVVPRSTLEKRVVMPEGSTSGYKLVKSGNFVISLRSFQGGLEYSECQGLVSPAYTVLAPIKEIGDIFYKFYFKSFDFIGHLAVAVIGIRDGKQISYNDFSFLTLPYPPLPEQRKIAKVLTTADKEISALETRLAHLQQEKKALMQQLLTGKRRVVVAES